VSFNLSIKGCPFCFLSKKNKVLAVMNHFLIIKNIRPIVKGHILLITKDHLREEDEFPKEVRAEFPLASNRAIRIIKEKMDCSVSSFVNGKDDQSVFHYHRHFFPSVLGVLGFEKALINFLRKK